MVTERKVMLNREANTAQREPLAFATAPERGRRGFTLIEVLLAIALAGIILIAALGAIMSAVRTNRTTAMQVAATNAVRRQIEEVLTVGRENSLSLDNTTATVVAYYGDKGTIEKDAGGKSIGVRYAFPLPVPGSKARDDSGAPLPDPRGEGVMIIYLAEEEVPSVGNSLAAEEAEDFAWIDISKNVTSGDIGLGYKFVDGRKAPVRADKGFDMNHDGEVKSKAADYIAFIGNPAGRVEDFDLAQLPIDISVTYYENADHKRESYFTMRRLMVTSDAGVLSGF